MSNEESIAGINVRELREEKQRLHKMHKVYEEAYQFQEKRIEELEEALRALQQRLWRHVSEYEATKGSMYLTSAGHYAAMLRITGDALGEHDMSALSPSEASEKEGEDG